MVGLYEQPGTMETWTDMEIHILVFVRTGGGQFSNFNIKVSLT